MLQVDKGGEILCSLIREAFPWSNTGAGLWKTGKHTREGDRLLGKGPWENMACLRNEKERDRTATEAITGKKGESTFCYAKESGLYLQWNGNQGSFLSKGVTWLHLVRQKLLLLSWKRMETFSKVRQTREKEARDSG